ARRKAQRLGITLCTVASARSDLWDVGLQVPVVVTEVRCMALLPSFDVYLTPENKLPGDFGFTINDQSLEDLLVESLLNRKIQCPTSNTNFDWQAEELGDSLFIRDVDSNALPISNFKAGVALAIEYYFGYVQDTPNTK